jgi:DNA ligase 1
MKYSELVEVYERLESTSKRLEKTYYISELLKKTPKEELEKIVLLLQGRVFPRTEERNLGIASKLIIKALKLATGNEESKIHTSWKKLGDLGKVAEELTKNKVQFTLGKEDLTVDKIFDSIRKLVDIEGKGSQDKKFQIIANLLTSAEPKEAKFIVKTVIEELRLGTGEGTLRDATVWAFFKEEIELTYDKENHKISYNDKYKEYSALVQRAYDLTSEFGKVAIAAKEGKKALKDIKLEVGNPIKVMLGPKELTMEKAMDRVGKPCVVEFKYDGFRVLIHKNGEEIKLFTRRLENVTNQFPDVVKTIISNVKAKRGIIDAEIVGYDPKTKKHLPFQKISQRIKRKYDIEDISKKFPVEVNAFDVLQIEDENIIEKSYTERRKLLEGIIEEKERTIVLAKQITTDKEEDAREFFNLALDDGQEGVMFKSLDAPYKPGARVGHMVKFKEAMETVDLVIIGAEWGEGKRSGWLSSFKIACQDSENNLLEIGKVSTGLKEKPEEGLSFGEMTEKLKELVIEEKGKSVIVKPSLVIEVEFEEIQKSPSYSSGYALRFPRVIRLREDKGLDDIAIVEEIERQYREQRGRG